MLFKNLNKRILLPGFKIAIFGGLAVFFTIFYIFYHEPPALILKLAIVFLYVSAIGNVWLLVDVKITSTIVYNKIRKKYKLIIHEYEIYLCIVKDDNYEVDERKLTNSSIDLLKSIEDAILKAMLTEKHLEKAKKMTEKVRMYMKMT